MRGFAKLYEMTYAENEEATFDEAGALGVLDLMRARVRVAEGQPALGTAGAVAGGGD